MMTPEYLCEIRTMLDQGLKNGGIISDLLDEIERLTPKVPKASKFDHIGSDPAEIQERNAQAE